MTASFQIVGDLGVYYERIAVTLGFVTLVASIASFISCRSFTSLFSRFAHGNLLENKFYKSFYKYHAYYWWSFLIILTMHIMSATIHTELLPGPDDPDALEHWLILSFAFGSLMAILIQYSSCRSFASLVDFFTQKNLVSVRIYNGFYRFHAYYWWGFLAAVAGHIIAAAIHTNFWPS